MPLSALSANLGQGAVYAVITFIFIIVAKKIADTRTTDIDDDLEIQDKQNTAVGFRRTGLYLAYAIAFAGTLSQDGAGFTADVIALFIDGVIITICLFSCRFINDRVMLAHIDNDREAKKGNRAVGLAECGMYIATALVLNGSFSGTSDRVLDGILSAVVFFVVGQAALLVFGYCYEQITPFNVRNEIEKGNVAAGVALAGMLVALGVILRSSIAGPFEGWAADFLSFGLYTVYGMVLLLIFRMAIDRFLLPGISLAKIVEKDRNVAAIVVAEAGLVAVAIVISSVM